MESCIIQETSVNFRLNFGRKGGEEAGCLVDESCLEQGMSRPNGCFELSHVGLGSGDWYVRHQSGLSQCPYDYVLIEG